MSKSSTASVSKPQLPTKSAWSRGPPQNTSAPTPRSQSPAPSTSVHQTHSRRPSTLGQGVSIKDGVSIPPKNVGAVKQGSAVTFGSIDDDPAPISSSPAAAPPIKSEGVKSFGSVPATQSHVNGKLSISSRPTPSQPPPLSSSTPPPSQVPPASMKLDKKDIMKFFQNPTSMPSSSTPSDSSSPSLRTSSLPTPSSSQPSASQPPPQISSPQYSYTPAGRPPPQGAGSRVPSSPVYPQRPMANGNGPRPQGGPNAGPSQITPGLGSPRLGPHPHPGQPSTMPPSNMPPSVQPQMQPQMPWPYYYAEPSYPYWYPMPSMQQPSISHHSLPPTNQHGPLHNGMPVSPRGQPPSLPPGTPTQAHAVAANIHPPQHSHSNSISITSPPPTPSTAGARLNANSSTFVPSKKIVLKNAEGREVDLTMIKNSISTNPPGSPGPRSGFRQPSPNTPAAATPARRPASIRLESEEQQKRRLAEEEERKRETEKAKTEAEEKERIEKEEQEKEKERERNQKEEVERREKEEAERLKKEELEREAEKLRKEEEKRKQEEEEREQLRREEEKQKVKEEEERRRKEEEEEERKAEAERERTRIQEERRRKEEEIERERLRQEEEEAARAKAAAESASSPAELGSEPEPKSAVDFNAEKEREDGEVVETDELSPTAEAAKEKPKDILRINTTTSPVVDFPKKRPGPLDLTGTKSGSIASPLPSALATAKHIDRLDDVSYPAGVKSPAPDLNRDAKDGKFRYDRAFLLQFMEICKEKPDNLPPLDAIGLEPNSDMSGLAMTRGGSGRHRQSSGVAAPSRQASVGLGFSSSFTKAGAAIPSGMGNFSSTTKLSSEERFNLATANRAVSVGATVPYGRAPQIQRTASQSGVGGTPMSSNRTRSRRGERRPPDGNKAGGQQHGYGHGQSNMSQVPSMEPVAPLQMSENRWDRRVLNVDADSPEMVDRKVKGLLNKLTMEKFDPISDQIVAWANKSETEKDGRTLIQVIRLVFEKATDEATWSEMYARLCRKMMERISPQVQDDDIKNSDGRPITGGQLFRKYLLNRCQEDFERGWVNKEATAAAAATKALEDQAAKAAHEKSKADGGEEIVLYSDEYYAAQKAKRQGLGLIKFIGELFKLQMLTERIMHECVRKLLGNVDNPEEEEIESLCKLLSTVGALLDTIKARAHIDVYFSRMRELTKSLNVSSRMQFMLQDVIELRDRKWVSRNAVAAPSTIAQIHEAAAKEKAAAEKESFQRQVSMSRGGSRRGGDRSDYPPPGADGWAVAGGNGPVRPPPKAGDLSNFGKITKNATMTFGPSSVFAGKKDKREPLSRTNSNSNMFSMLSQNAEPPAEPKAPEAQRKRLVLQPRTKPATEEPDAHAAKSESDSEDEEIELAEEQAQKKIEEDLKEFFAVRNLDEAEVYFTSLPPAHHSRLVDKLTSHALESKEADAQLVADIFARAVSKDLCAPAFLEEGLTPIAESIYDIAIDAPKAYQLFATIVKGAGLDEERRKRLASKSTDDPDKLLALLL